MVLFYKTVISGGNFKAKETNMVLRNFFILFYFCLAKLTWIYFPQFNVKLKS